MNAAVWHAARDIRVEEVREPGEPQQGDAVVGVSVACICGSDLAEYRDGPHVIPTDRPHPLTKKKAPIILGHEYVGRVLSLGEDISGLKVGDRVCGDACLRCGTCYWCLRGEYNICAVGGSVGLHADGAFAPLLVVPAYSLYKVPDGISDQCAAVVEPLAVGLHALKRTKFQAGDNVVVIGYGMIGAATASVALCLGARTVIVVEPLAYRAELALSMGAAAVLDPASVDLRREIRALTGIGADVVIECSGNSHVLGSAIDMSRRGGRVGICSIARNPAKLAAERVVYFEREIIGVLGYRFDHSTILDLISSQRLDIAAVIGSKIALKDIVPAGFDVMMNDPRAPLRIPVLPT